MRLTSLTRGELVTMAGTSAGGKKAVQKILAKDPNFYAKIGKIGGQRGHDGGFASQKVSGDGLTGLQRARIAGAKGGRISRRRKVITIASDQDQAA